MARAAYVAVVANQTLWGNTLVGPRQRDNSYRLRAVTRSSTVPRSRAADWQAIR